MRATEASYVVTLLLLETASINPQGISNAVLIARPVADENGQDFFT